MQKRILSLFLCVAMVLSMLPAQAFAEEIPEETLMQIPETVETTAPAATAETVEETAEPVPQTEFVPETVCETVTTEETFPTEVIEEAAASVTASGMCGTNLVWTLEDNGTLTISGSGAMNKYYSYNSNPWINYRSSITTLVLEEGITCITQEAFSEFANITRVTIPGSVEYIEGLAFESCTALEEVILSEGVESLRGQTFYNCKNLVRIVLPNSLTTVRADAFQNCDNLTEVIIGEEHPTLKVVDGVIFSSDGLVLTCCPAGMRGIYQIPQGTKAIGEYAFTSNSLLTEVLIPDSVVEIGSRAFSYCDRLQTITIPESVTVLGEGAFYGCNALRQVSILGNIGQIDNLTFHACYRLTAVELPSGINRIGDSAFAGCVALKSIAIPDGVISLGEAAFHGCSALETVTMADTVTMLGIRAFGGCKALTDITLSKRLKEIGGYAFQNCVMLTQIVIPANVTKLDNYAFTQCTALKTITFRGNAPTFGKYGVFTSVEATAYYPDSVITWTDSVKKDYGGSIEWLPYTTTGASDVTISDYLDNSAITINSLGQAYAHYITKPNKTVWYEIVDDWDYAVSDAHGIVRIPLGSFYEEGTHNITVRFTEVGNEALIPSVDKEVKVTVEPLHFDQDWQFSFGAHAAVTLGKQIGVSGQIGSTAIGVEAALGKAALGLGAEYALHLKREYSEDGVAIELTSDKKVDGDLTFKSGVTAEAGKASFDVAEVSTGGEVGISGTYGIRIDDYTGGISDTTVIGTFLLGEILSANTNNIFLRPFYTAMADRLYESDNLTTIMGSGVGYAAFHDTNIAALKINDQELFSGYTNNWELSFTASELTTDRGRTEKEVSYRSEEKTILWNDVLVKGHLGANLLGHENTIRAVYDVNRTSIEAESLIEEDNAYKTFVLQESYVSRYNRFLFRDEALEKLLRSTRHYDDFLNTDLAVLTTKDVGELAAVISQSDIPVEYSRIAKNQMIYSLPISLSAALGVVGASGSIDLSYMKSNSVVEANGVVINDQIYLVNDSDLLEDVEEEAVELGAFIKSSLGGLKADIQEFYKVISNNVKKGVKAARAWIAEQKESVKNWILSLTCVDPGGGGGVWSVSYNVAVCSARPANTLLAEGIADTEAGDIIWSRAATVGQSVLVGVEDAATGETITDLSEEPLEFTIQYTVEDLEAAGLTLDSSIVQEGGIAMYRYSDEGDYFEYVGGVNNLDERTVTATIVKTGQYVLAVDACAPQLYSLDLSDFRETPTITARIDDMTGLDQSSFVFALDGNVKVDGRNIAECYNAKAGLFTYTVSEAEALTEGAHTMSFTLSDTSGNSETYEYSFHVDLTAPAVSNVTVEGFTNAGDAVMIRANVSDENLIGVYAVFSKLLPDGNWSEEVFTAMGDMGSGIWGLDYEGDGSIVKVYIKAVDIADNETCSAVCEANPFVEKVELTQAYLALHQGQSAQPHAVVYPGILAEQIRWTVDNEKVISVNKATGEVTAEGVGTAYVTASVIDVAGNELSARCRIDVAAPIELEGIQLSAAKLTTELYSTSYAEFDILLKLPQNYAAAASATAFTPEDRGVAIEAARFADEAMAKLFELIPLDDRTVAVVPTEAARADTKAVQSKYVSSVIVTVQGVDYPSEPLTLTVKKTLPKLKTTIPAFNNFWSGKTQEITVTGATVTGISCENLPDWLSLYAGELSLNENVLVKGGSAKLTLLVETEEWAVPIETALAVKCSYKAPGLKLSASSVQLAGVNSDGVKLQLLSKDKKLTLSDLGVSGISAPEGYSISNYNAEDGTFVIKAEEGFQPGKTNLEVRFSNTEEMVSLPLTVKVTPVTLKLTPNSITLNSGTGDSAAVTVTATPADYRVTAPNIRIVDAAKQDKTNSGELKLSYENGRLSISTTDLTPDNAKYTLYISAEGGKEAALKISTTNAEPTLKLKANGNLDLSFPDRKIGLTTTLKNHSGGNLKAIDYTVTESSGKTILDEDSKAIRLTKDGADLFVQLKETAGINIKNTYTLNLKLTLADDSVLESSVKIPVKQTAVNLKLSANKLTLNKAIGDKATVTVTCATKDYNFTEPVWTLLDSKGNDASGQLDISWNNGKLTVATTEATPYGGSYKLMIAPEKGAKAVALAIVIPAEAKSKVTGTLKATGNLDVIRDGTALTVTPTWKNCNDAEKTETLTIRNGNGEDVTANFSITEKAGKYILTRGADLDHTQKYTATLTATFANGEIAVATGALKLKMGSAKLTVNADSTTLFANDKHSRVNISFVSADTTLNKVARVELDPKLANQFELFDYGNGQYAIGFKDGNIPAKITSVNLALNVWLEGNETAKANASVKVKLSMIR